MASSLNISAFHIGNALGAAISGIVIKTGFALPGAPAAGAVISAVGLALIWVIIMLDKHPRRNM